MITSENSIAMASGAPVASGRRLHIEYLDGLRGVAALYVVLGHFYIAMRFWAPAGTFAPRLITVFSIFNVGQTAVDIFIVLSGYCLMLPVAQSQNGELRGGVADYIRRRARRILPPYFFAIIFALALRALRDSIVNPTGTLHSSDFTAGNLLSHLFVVHNLTPWIHGIDPPMWSVATEWQIYFIFPLLLLPTWKRFGVTASVAVAFALAVAIHFLFQGRVDQAYPWFIGLFALGMAGAVISFHHSERIHGWRERFPWGVAASVTWAGTLGYCLLHKGWYPRHQWIADPLFGLATMLLLVYCTRHLTERSTGPSPIPRLLSSRWAVFAGAFSYSIYLAHYPLLELFVTLTLRLPVSGISKYALLLGVCLPLILIICYLFHLVCERPFMPGFPHVKRASDSAGGRGSQK